MVSLLIDAVNAKQAISFTYRGQRRIVEPHAIGIGHDGGEWLSAFLIYGKVIVPGNSWLYCPVTHLEEIELEPEIFPGVRPGYTVSDTRFQRYYAAL